MSNTPKIVHRICCGYARDEYGTLYVNNPQRGYVPLPTAGATPDRFRSFVSQMKGLIYARRTQAAVDADRAKRGEVVIAKRLQEEE